MNENLRCQQGQISLGHFCIQKSIVDKQGVELSKVILKVNIDDEINIDELHTHASNDIIDCPSYIEIGLKDSEIMKICGQSTDQFDCKQNFYQLTDTE